MNPRVFAVALSAAFIFAPPVPAVRAMDADALSPRAEPRARTTMQSCDSILRKLNRAKRKLNAEADKLEELRIEENEIKAGGSPKLINAHRAKIKNQKERVKEAQNEVTDWEIGYAQNC